MLRFLATVVLLVVLTGPAIAAPTTAAPRHFVEPHETLITDQLNVRAGEYQYYKVSLNRGETLAARFRVSGGVNQKVAVYLLNLDNFNRFAAGAQFSYYEGTSGVVRQFGEYRFRIPETNVFYLVVDNRGALMLGRKVDLYVYRVFPEPTQASIAETEKLAKFYEMLKSMFVFTDFSIAYRHCGIENAWSNPNITMCIELEQMLKKQKLDQAFMYVMFHELGHSLLNVWGYPLHENEDVADEFATVFMILLNKQDAALAAAQWWAADASKDAAVAKLWIDDRHTISPQRARNIVRWLNQPHQLLVKWQKILVPNMTTEALSKMAEGKASWIDRQLIAGELRKRGAQAVGASLTQ